MEPLLPGLGRLSRWGTAERPLLSLSLSLPLALDPPTASSRSSWLRALCPQLQGPAPGRCSKPGAGAGTVPQSPSGRRDPRPASPRPLPFSRRGLAPAARRPGHLMARWPGAQVRGQRGLRAAAAGAGQSARWRTHGRDWFPGGEGREGAGKGGEERGGAGRSRRTGLTAAALRGGGAGVVPAGSASHCASPARLRTQATELDCPVSP